MVDSEENAFCAIYADTALPAADLLQAIIPTAPAAPSVVVQGVKIEVRRNGERDASKRSDFPDGFLWFERRIEIESDGGDAAVELVAGILRSLWGLGIPAVAACPFEDLLPDSGGYRSRAHPWPLRVATVP